MARRGRSYRAPKRRGLSSAQVAAHERALDACDYTVEGNYARGDVVADIQDRVWRVATHGIRYHQDRPPMYGVQPTRGPKGWAQTVELRGIIRQVQGGTPEPGSRMGDAQSQQPRPAGEAIATWQDARHASQAIMPTLTVYEGGVLGVVRPIYDDAPAAAWLRDRKLARRALTLIGACPEPVLLPVVSLTERQMRLTIEESSPRFAAYMAARGAVYTPAHRGPLGGEMPARIDLPMPEWRRIRAELEAAEQEEA